MLFSVLLNCVLKMKFVLIPFFVCMRSSNAKSYSCFYFVAAFPCACGISFIQSSKLYHILLITPIAANLENKLNYFIVSLRVIKWQAEKQSYINKHRNHLSNNQSINQLFVYSHGHFNHDLLKINQSYGN